MDYNNLSKYFNRFIKPYLPFKNNKTYQSFCALLKDNYLKDSYITIPENMSYFVEQQKIQSTLYDKLLIGNGYPDTLVAELSVTDKEKILEKLMHYQDESGTLSHFKKICNTFNDLFNVYELYGDYRRVISDGKVIMDWVMAPRPIYKFNSIDDVIYDYDEIYNATPTYFLSKNQLEFWRRSGSIVLPFKTNLIVLDWQNINDFSVLDAVISMTALSYFQNEQVGLNINNNGYVLTIGTIYQLWNYLSSYIAPNQVTFDSSFKCVSITLSSDFPYSLDPNAPNAIDNVILTYNQIVDGESFDVFWKTAIEDKFTKYISGSSLTLAEMRKKLTGSISVILLSYLEDIIDSAPSKLKGLYQALSILDSALSEFIETSPDELASKYEKHLKLLMVRPVVDPTSTVTYKLLDKFKPYHTQFITMAKFKTTSKDSTNKFYAKDKVYFVKHNWFSSSPVISDSYVFKKSYFGEYYLENGKNTVTSLCTNFYSLSIGNYITFSQTFNPESICQEMQIIDITTANDTITQSRIDQISNQIRSYSNTIISELLSKLLNQTDSLGYDIIDDQNNNNILYFTTIDANLDTYVNDNVLDLDRFKTFLNTLDFVSLKIKNEITSGINTLPLPINRDQITYLFTTIKNNYIIRSDELVAIKKILRSDDMCTLVFDRNWECPTNTYDKITTITMQSVNDVIEVEGALFTFTNISMTKYIHTNEIGFVSVGIGDYIYVIDDTFESAVKIIGKDMNNLNLLIEKAYSGTAGTFSTVGRYRP